MKYIAVLAAFAALSFAVPTGENQAIEAREPAVNVTLGARGEYCPVGPPNMSIVDQVYRICVQRGLDSKLRLSTFMTALVESNFNNLPCGDLDSEGVWQQRKSQGWKNPRDVNYSTNRFLDELIKCGRDHPGYSPGQVAQCCQRSARPNAYDQMRGRAQALLDEASRRNGGGGGGNDDDDDNSGNGSPQNAAKPPLKNNNGGAPKGCHKTVKVVKGDNCKKCAQRGGVSVDTLRSLNKSINKGCTNLKVGQILCAKKNK